MITIIYTISVIFRWRLELHGIANQSMGWIRAKEEYNPRSLSTFALTLFRYQHTAEDGDWSWLLWYVLIDYWLILAEPHQMVQEHPASKSDPQRCCVRLCQAVSSPFLIAPSWEDGRRWTIDFWDTAGQEQFAKLHASYYFQVLKRGRNERIGVSKSGGWGPEKQPKWNTRNSPCKE